MNAKLQKIYDALEEQRNSLLTSLRHLPVDKLNFQPPGKWSINYILAHLITAEKVSIQYLQKKILGINETGNTGVAEEIKMILLILSQRLPFKFKAPRAIVESTSSYDNFESMVNDWNKTREELKSILEKFQDDQIKKKVYKHIRVGRLNVIQALLFFREHIIHHSPQLKRLLNQD